MPMDSLVVLSIALEIPARRAEYSLTENALSPGLKIPTLTVHLPVENWQVRPDSRGCEVRGSFSPPGFALTFC